MNTQKKPRITDSEVAHIKTLRDMAKTLKQRLDKIEVELEAIETFVTTSMDSGAVNVHHLIFWLKKPLRKNRRYKEEIEKHLGEVVPNEIIDRTEVKISKKLIIAAFY